MKRRFTLKLGGRRYDRCAFVTGYYANSYALAIKIAREGESGAMEPLISLTENLGPQPAHHAAIKIPKENTNILSEMQQLGLIKKVSRNITHSFTTYPVCEIDERILCEYAA